MGWFRRSQDELLKSLLTLEQERVRVAADIEVKRQEIEMRKLTLEVEHAEQLAKARAIEMDAKQDRKIKNREAGLRSAASKASAKVRAAAENPPCPVCDDEHSPKLTAADIAWHHAGHPANFNMPLNWN